VVSDGRAEQGEERKQVNQAEQSGRSSVAPLTADDEPLLAWQGGRAPSAVARAYAGPAMTAADMANGGGTPREGDGGRGGVSRETDRHLTAGEDTPIMRQAETAVMVQNRRSESLREPADTRVLIVANQKGGVGKTTTAVNLAAALSVCGLRVLVVDLDPQGNASTALGIDRWASDLPSIYDALIDDKPLGDVVRKVDGYESLFCVPATIDLAGAEIELVEMKSRESRLRSVLGEHLTDATGASRYDYVFIDCPPSLGLLTVNALVGGDEVLIPIQCEYYALEGLSQLLSNIELVQSHLNPGLEVSTILLTMFDGRTRLAAQVVDEVRKHFGETALRTMIPRSVRISEAPSYGQTVLTYDPGSSGAMSYLDAARELTERVAPPSADGVAGASAGPTAKSPAGGDNDVLIERKS
jgi:chromosome partitioning protein